MKSMADPGQSLGACFIIATSAIIRMRNMRKSALRAQQVTLGAAVFDKGGRILIDSNGFIPSTVITDSFLEKVDIYTLTCRRWLLTHFARILKTALVSVTRSSNGCSWHQGTGVLSRTLSAV